MSNPIDGIRRVADVLRQQMLEAAARQRAPRAAQRQAQSAAQAQSQSPHAPGTAAASGTRGDAVTRSVIGGSPDAQQGPIRPFSFVGGLSPTTTPIAQPAAVPPEPAAMPGRGADGGPEPALGTPEATDAAAQRVRDAEQARDENSNPHLRHEYDQAVLGARTALREAVQAEIAARLENAGGRATIDDVGTEILARYENDPVVQPTVRAALDTRGIDEEVESLRQPIVSATDPAQIPALLDAALAEASPLAQQRLLNDPQVRAALDEAAAYINEPLDAIAEAEAGFHDVPTAVDESLQRLDELTRDVDPRIVAALVGRNLDRLESEYEALQQRDDLYPEDKAMISWSSWAVLAEVSDRMSGVPGGDRIVERMADLIVDSYSSTDGSQVNYAALMGDLDQLSVSVGGSGHGGELFLEVAAELRARGESQLADEVTSHFVQGLQSYVEEDWGGLNTAVNDYLEHTAELTWLIQNYGATMPPEELQARIEAYIAEQGPEWEQRLNELEQQVAQEAATLLQQVEQLRALPPEVREELGIDETLESLLENPSVQLAISLAAGRHPEMLANVDLPEAISFLEGVGASQKILSALANAHVQTQVLGVIGELDPNDPASVARVRSVLDELRGSELAAAWGISEQQLDEVVDALEATIPGPGTTPAQAEAALAEYNSTLNGIEAFDQHSPLGQAFRALGLGVSVVGLAQSVPGFIDDPSFDGAVQALADTVGLLRDVGELGQGLGWISETNPLSRLAANSTVGRLLGGVGIVFGTVSVLNELEEGDLAQAGLGAAAVGGTALALFGSASWAGPVGWAVAAFATAGSLGLNQWRRVQDSNEHMNETSEAFLRGSGLTADAASTLVDQDSEGLSPVPALFELGRMHGMTPDQVVDWLNGLQEQGELDDLRQQVHGMISGSHRELTTEDAAELRAWIAENLPPDALAATLQPLTEPLSQHRELIERGYSDNDVAIIRLESEINAGRQRLDAMIRSDIDYEMSIDRFGGERLSFEEAADLVLERYPEGSLAREEVAAAIDRLRNGRGLDQG